MVFRRRFHARRRMPFGRRVRRYTGMVLTKRGVFTQLTIPDVTSADFDNRLNIPLLTCVEAVDDTAISNGTTIASCPLYSKLLKLRTRFVIDPQATTTIIRYMLVKAPDNDDPVVALGVGLTDATFHGSEDTSLNRELRENTLSKGFLITGTAGDPLWFAPRFRRKTLARLGSLKETDRINLHLAKNAAGTTLSLSGMMTAHIKANA